LVHRARKWCRTGLEIAEIGVIDQRKAAQFGRSGNKIRALLSD
jgi:hypothetical protein